MTPLVLVLGPTGSGKSALALNIAEHLRGEIVNCDSLQLYRGFDIGTAKPTPEERRRVPHHLFDILEAHETFTAGEYARAGRTVLKDIADRGHLPVVTGGTGFYARALVEGLFPAPARDERLRRRLLAMEQRRPGVLHRALRRCDATAAQRIHRNDTNKLIRAMEVCLVARRPMSELFNDGRDALTGFKIITVVLDPPRKELNARLDTRCRDMLENGLVQEIALLLLSGVSPKSKPFEAIGYKEVLSVLQGELAFADAFLLMQRNTRRYAKRQATWFRSERDALRVDSFGTDLITQRSVVANVVGNMQ